MYLYSINLKPTMKAAFVKEKSQIILDEVDKPALGSGDIFVKMESCGICGSDLEKVFGQYGKTSIKLGHEPAGIISEVGSNVTKFKKGDRVFTHHHVPCYSCHYCKHGNETICPKYSETNLYPCGLAEEYLVPEWNVSHGGVLKIPDSMSYDEAAMIEPLACCIRAWNKLPLYQNGDSVAIFGVGPTGMMHVMLAKAKGFEKIFCLDVNQFRLDFAREFGVTGSLNSKNPEREKLIKNETSEMGIDFAIVATGSIPALKDSISIVRNGGTIMVFGVPSKGDIIDLDMSQVYSKEISILTSYAASDKDTKEALDLISSGQIAVKKLITHRYSLSDSQKAFDHAHSGQNAMKIVIAK